MLRILGDDSRKSPPKINSAREDQAWEAFMGNVLSEIYAWERGFPN